MLPLFTKNHYEAIAQIISQLPKESQKPAIDRFSEKFEKDNLLFQKARFIESCRKAGALVS